MLKITFLLLASTTRCRSSTRYDAKRNRTTTRARENEEREGRGEEDSSKRENRNNKRFSPFSIDVSFRRDTRPDGAQRVITKEELRVYIVERETGRRKEGRAVCSIPRALPDCATVQSVSRYIYSPDCLDLISISRNSMITKDRESVRRRARIIFISNWIHGGGSEGLSLS